MELTKKDSRWFGRKNKKAKTLEDVTDIAVFQGDFCSVLGKAGRTEFHSYLGKSGNKWLEMYGVTSLLNYWGEKDKLVQWAVDKAVDYILAGEGEDIFNEARSAHKKALGEAGDHGKSVHALAEAWIKSRMEGRTTLFQEEPPSQLLDFIGWANQNGVTFLESEKTVYSRNLWVAGTMDILLEMKGKKYIADIKTSRYVSYKQFVQCGAYAYMSGEKIDGLLIIHMPKDGGFRIYKDDDVDGYIEDFKSIVRLVKRDKDKSYELYSS